MNTSHKVKDKMFSEDTTLEVNQPQNGAYIGRNVEFISKSDITTGTKYDSR